MRKLIATATSLALLTPLTQLPLQSAYAAEDLASRFTLGVMPDTQFYSRYGTENQGNIFVPRYGSNPYAVQTKFLADNHKELGTEFVTHLGDVVDQPRDLASWEIADAAMKTLENAKVNYSILPGNHDLAMIADEQGNAQPVFGKYFPESRAEKNTTFQGRHQSENIFRLPEGNPSRDRYNFPGQTVESEYHIFEAEGQKYLVLALGFRANDDTIDWAQKVINEHPTLPVILTAHEISGIDGSGKTFYTPQYGEHLFEKLIKKNDQIFLTIAGHHHGAGYHFSTNEKGNQVINILQDYQMAYLGGNGLMGQLQFDLTNNKLEMLAYSPWVKTKKHEQLTHFDHLIMEGKGDTYSIDIDFDKRFAGFNEAWVKGDENDPNYNEILRTKLTDGYKPYVITEADKPKDSEDYVKVPGTAVHWRPGQTTFEGKQLVDGAAAPAGSVIPDVNKGADMTRAKYVDGTNDKSVTYSKDTHPLSSDTGSLYWSNPTSKQAVSWFETATGADINSMNFPNGYTVEAFLKLDEGFNGSVNGWSNALIREAPVSKVDTNDDDGDPAQMLGVSNLRELRWWSIGDNLKGHSNWTHEVPKGEWMHVAVVNDPNDPDGPSVKMYVDGAPILRDGYGPIGIGGRDFKWLLGTSAWEGEKEDGWFGNIGEIRIVNHPIGEDQWLTARALKTEQPTTPTGPTTKPEPQPEPQPQNDKSSDVGSSIGIFAGGVVVGLAAAVAALLFVASQMGGALGALVEQFRGLLPF